MSHNTHKRRRLTVSEKYQKSEDKRKDERKVSHKHVKKSGKKRHRHKSEQKEEEEEAETNEEKGGDSSKGSDSDEDVPKHKKSATVSDHDEDHYDMKPLKPVYVCNPCGFCFCCGGCCNLRKVCFLIAIFFLISGAKNLFETKIYHMGNLCDKDRNKVAEVEAQCESFLPIYEAVGMLWLINGVVSLVVCGSLLTALILPEDELCSVFACWPTLLAALAILLGMLLTIIRYTLLAYLISTFNNIMLTYLFENEYLQEFFQQTGLNREEIENGAREEIDSKIFQFLITPMAAFVILTLLFEVWYDVCVFQFRKQILAGISREPVKSGRRVREDLPPAFGQPHH